MQNQNNNKCECGCESQDGCIFTGDLSDAYKEFCIEFPEQLPQVEVVAPNAEQPESNEDQEIFIQPYIEMIAPEITTVEIPEVQIEQLAPSAEIETVNIDWDEDTKRFYFLIRPFVVGLEVQFNWQVSNGSRVYNLWLDDPEPFFEKLFEIYEPDQLWINQLFRAKENKARADFRLVFDYDHKNQTLNYKPVKNTAENVAEIEAELKNKIRDVLCPSGVELKFEVAHNASNGSMHIYTNYYIKRRYDFHWDDGTDFDFSQTTFDLTGMEVYNAICRKICNKLRYSRYDYKHSFDSNISGLRAPLCGKMVDGKIESASKYVFSEPAATICAHSLFNVDGLLPIPDSLLADIDYKKIVSRRPQMKKYARPDLQELADAIPDGFLSKGRDWRTYMRMFKYFEDPNGECYKAFDSASKRSTGYNAVDNLAQWNASFTQSPAKLLRHLAVKIPRLKPTTAYTEVCKKYLDSFPDVPTLGVWSGLGSGKTTKICEMISAMGEDVRILVISNRISLTKDIMRVLRGYSFTDYLEYKESTEQLPQMKDMARFVIQVDSLWRLRGAAKYDLVVVDESESVLTQFMSSQIKSNLCISIFERIVNVAAKVVFMDGLFSELSDRVLTKLRGNYSLIKNTWKYDNTYIIYDTEDQFRGSFLTCVGDGEKMVFVSPSRKAVVNYTEFAKVGRENTLMIHGNSDDHIKKEVYEDINKYMIEKNIDFFAYSPSITTGCDITVPIDDVYFFSKGSKCNFEAEIQMMFRPRNVKRFHIFVQHKDSKAREEEFTPQFQINRLLETYEAEYGENASVNMIFEQFGYGIFDEQGQFLYDNILPTIIFAYDELFTRLTKEHEKNMIIRYLRERGGTFLAAKELPKKEKVIVSAMYKQMAINVKEKELNDIVSAPDLLVCRDEGAPRTEQEKAIDVRRLYKDRYELEEITPQVVDMFFNPEAYATYRQWNENSERTLADVINTTRDSAQNRLIDNQRNEGGLTGLITTDIKNRGVMKLAVAAEMLAQLNIQSFAELRDSCVDTDSLNRLKNYMEINRSKIMAVFDHRDRSKTAITSWKPAQVTNLVNKVMRDSLGGKFTKAHCRDSYYSWEMELPWDSEGMPKLLRK